MSTSIDLYLSYFKGKCVEISDAKYYSYDFIAPDNRAEKTTYINQIDFTKDEVKELRKAWLYLEPVFKALKERDLVIREEED